MTGPRLPLVVILLLPVLAPSSHAQEKPLRGAIDAAVRAGWEKQKITPAKPATDAEFLRRVHLDLTGTIPTADEAVAFLDDTGPGKRAKLIDRLLADPRFAQHQADVWDMILFGRNPPGYDTDKRDGFQAWLRGRFEKNVPYDEWARELLRADGDSHDNGALFYVQYRNAPEDAIEVVTQTFLGVQLQCARCHDHPFEEWTQRDFYGMAAFLARLEVVNAGKKNNMNVFAIAEKSTGDIQFTGPAKDAAPGKKGEPVKPKFLLGQPLEEPTLPKDFKEVKFKPNEPPPKPKFSRKDRLAEWITSADNPFFARAVANRVWAQYMGRGIVHPVDNMSASNVPSHPELLDTLAKELKAHQFDLKWYIRELVNSGTYQLSSVGSGESRPEWFQHARSRPLSAEELIESWQIATGYLEGEKAAGKKPNASRFRPLESGYLLRFFGSPNTGTGDFQGGLHEHLYLNNGPLSRLYDGKAGLAAFVGDDKKPVAERVERLFVATLSRRPSPEEAEKFAAFLGDKGSASDAVWVLITCSEFRFNH